MRAGSFRLAIFAAALAAGGFALLAALWFGGPERIAWDDPVQVEQGRAIYAQNCAACHGRELEGEADWRRRKDNGRLPAPPHDASGHTWHHPGAQLFEITKSGMSAVVPGYESDMPVFGGVLSDAEIWAVLAFIKSTWPQEIRARHDALDARE